MRVIKTVEDIEGEGLLALMGEDVLIITSSYFYKGNLVGVNDTCIKLKDPYIVYETGKWTDLNYKDVQKLHTGEFYIQTSSIESFGVSK